MKSFDLSERAHFILVNVGARIVSDEMTETKTFHLRKTLNASEQEKFNVWERDLRSTKEGLDRLYRAQEWLHRYPRHVGIDASNEVSPPQLRKKNVTPDA